MKDLISEPIAWLGVYRTPAGGKGHAVSRKRERIEDLMKYGQNSEIRPLYDIPDDHVVIPRAVLESLQKASKDNGELDIIVAFNDGFNIQMNDDHGWLTDEANIELRWIVTRRRAPFCDHNGVPAWSGPSPQIAISRARSAFVVMGESHVK